MDVIDERLLRDRVERLVAVRKRQLLAIEDAAVLFDEMGHVP
jgi:hypothetical protein